jgi:hypothetical protein
MKKTLLFISAIAMSFGAFSQNNATKRCATVEYMNYRESLQTGYIQSTQDVFNTSKSSKTGNVAKSDETYIIPVVVHVVYNTQAHNLHDSVIHDQIRILNEDFNRFNADTVNMRSVFQPYAGSGNVEFRLADFDPNGNPTTGITRTQTSTTSFMDLMGFVTGDMSAMEKVKSTTDGGIDPWNQSRYLNIWVCNMAINFGGSETPALMGYATPPANLPNWPAGSVAGLSDGVVIQYQAFGSNNPNPINIQGQSYAVKGRTVTHEVGHYLGLRHIWGDGDCSQDDGIADTPNAAAQSEQDCDATKNTCVDNIGGADLPDMIENYMDYSAEDCQNSFTVEQMDLIRAVLEDNRFDLVNENPALSISKIEQLTASLHPNPANTVVTIKSEEYLTGVISMMDVNGKVVSETTANGLETTIDIEHLNNGVYQLFITGKTGAVKVMKVVKI